MKLSILLSVFTLSLSTTILTAQTKLPRWVNAAPNATTVVGNGATPDEAKMSAISALLSTVGFETMEGSIKSALMAKGVECPDQLSLMTEAVYKNNLFTVVNEVETEEAGCFAQCKMPNVQAALDEIFQSVTTEASRCLTEAKLYEGEGLAWKAAQSYCKGLKAIALVMNRPMITESGELGESLYEGYSHLFEGIGWLFDYDSFPMEQGQPLPLQISVSAYNPATNRVMKGIPCYIASSDRTAEYAASDSLTSEQGTVAIDIKKAPNASRFKFQACIDDGILERALPKNIATAAMLANVRKDIKTVSVEGYSFDPSVFYYMELDSIDNLTISTDYEALLNQKGWKKTDTKGNADIIVKIVYTQHDGDPQKFGKYFMTKYVCGSEISLTSTRTEKVILSGSQPNLDLMLRSDSNSDKVHTRASVELMKRLLPEITTQINNLEFDKRNEVYSLAKELRR